MDIDWCVSKLGELNGINSSHIKQWHLLKLLQHLSDIEVEHMDAIELRKKDIEVKNQSHSKHGPQSLKSSKIRH